MVCAGDLVRTIIPVAGLDARRQYRVMHIERPTLWASIAYVADEAGRLMPPIANAHLLLEHVGQAMAVRPGPAVLH